MPKANPQERVERPAHELIPHERPALSELFDGDLREVVGGNVLKTRHETGDPGTGSG